jgi:hypothetical protein
VACPGPSRSHARRAGAIIVAGTSMLTRHHYRRPNPDRRRALELLAGSRDGYTKAILRAHGFSMDMMVELVKAGLATTKRERIVAGGRQTALCVCGSRRRAGKRSQRCLSESRVLDP